MPKKPSSDDIAATIVDDAGEDPTTIEVPNPDAQPSEHAEWAVSYESNNVLDEPEPVSLEGFVGFGVEHISNAAGEFKVDPVTGYIVGPADA